MVRPAAWPTRPKVSTLYLILRLLEPSQSFQLAQKFSDILEIPVDGGEPNVSNLVQQFETIHQKLAQQCCGQLTLRAIRERGFGFINKLRQAAHTDRPFLAGPEQAVEYFLPIEFFSPPVFFDDHVGDFVATFVSGEATLAGQALTTPTDGLPLLALPGIDYFILAVGAKGASHSGL